MKRLSAGALALAAVVSIYPSGARAGAWTQKQGGGLAIVTGRYQYASPARAEINPLVEYGLNARLTIGTNLGYRALDRDAGKNRIGYAELYGRYLLWQGERQVLSAQFLAGSAARGLAARANASLGVAEARVLYGYGFRLGSWGSAYLDAQTGWRTFFNKAGSEWRSELSAGWKFYPGWIFLVQVFHTENLRSNPSPLDYDSWQTQVSLVAPVGHGWFVQGGWNKTVGGQRVRFDGNAFASVWYTW